MTTFTTRPELTGDFGMVAATHWIAAAVGMSLLERGGNAFDAAAGAGFTMQVVEPHLCGPAGEAPMLVHDAGTGETSVIAGQGPAPAAATIEHFDEQGLSLVPGTGLLAACVPGAFDAWMTLLERFGTMTVAEVLEPAIGYATRGFTVHDSMAAAIAAVVDVFRDTGRRRRRCTSLMARCRRSAPASPTPSWPPPTGGSRRLRPRPATVRPASPRPGRRLPAGSSLTPSTPSAGPSWPTAPAVPTPGCWTGTTWLAGRPRSRRRCGSTTGRTGWPRPGRGPRGR